MKLIVGLGNPGEKYRGTRHNVGFMVVDELAQRCRVTFETGPVEALQARLRPPHPPALLAKPLTFMNLSGRAVSGLLRYFRIEPVDLLVVLDDAALPLARLRARAGGSSGGHNGLRSIAQEIGTGDYARLRVGVGRGETWRDLADHVLGRFDADERPLVERAVARAADAAELFLREDIAAVMNRFNPTSEDETPPQGAAAQK